MSMNPHHQSLIEEALSALWLISAVIMYISKLDQHPRWRWAFYIAIYQAVSCFAFSIYFAIIANF